MSILTRNESVSFAACFGLIATLVFRIIFESKQAIAYDGPTWGAPFVTVLSMFIYGIDCFPMFAAVSLRNAVSFGFGTAYTWTFSAFSVWSMYDCDMYKSARVAYTFQNIFNLASLLYLSLRMPYGLYEEIMRYHRTGSWEKKEQSDSLTNVRESHSGRQVTELLKTPVKQHEEEHNKVYSFFERILAAVWGFVKEWTYTWEPGFKYSARMLSIMWIGFVILYMAAFRSIWAATNLFLYITDAARYALNGMGWDDQSGDSDLEKMTRIILKVYFYGMTALWLLNIFCIALAFIIGTLNILYILKDYRENLKSLYRGDNRYIPARKDLDNVDMLTGSMKYAGFQIGYIAWALVIQAFFFFWIVILAVLVIVILIIGFSDWLSMMSQYAGPWLVIFIVILIIQWLLVKYVFLQNHKESLAIDNRRFLFLVTYFLFFYNVFIGLVSCLLRLIKSMILGLLMISRLDHSILPKKYELRDKGFERYAGFMHIECYHTHPCLPVFIRLLKSSHKETKAKLTDAVPDSSQCPTPEEEKFQNKLRRNILSMCFGGSSASTKRRNNKIADGDAVAMEEGVDLSSNKTVSGNAKANNCATDIKDTDISANSVGNDQVLPSDSGESGYAKANNLAAQINKQCEQPNPGTVSKKESKSGCAADVEVSTNRISGESEEISDPWVKMRDSPVLAKYRRKQRAAFQWSLVYTLHSNPQLILERRGFIQQRMAKLDSKRTEKEKSDLSAVAKLFKSKMDKDDFTSVKKKS